MYPRRRIFAAPLLAIATLPAVAALGDVRPDLREPRAAYGVVQQTLPSGTRVTQYVDRQRTVFAVTWSGPYLPELRELLGQHHQALIEAQARGSLHAPVVVRTSQVAIVSAAGAGAFTGRAWLPTRLPAGFDVKELP